MRNKITFYLFSIIFIILSGMQLFAVKNGGKGRDFWLTFIPNFHGSDSQVMSGDSLFIFILSEKPCSGKIDYVDYNSRTYTQVFTIANPQIIYSFRKEYSLYELRGFNNSGYIATNSQCEKPAPQSFHVTCDEDVTVYAHNQAVTTSDAFYVFPTGTLGNNYLIMSYNSDGYDQNSGPYPSSTPSQFAIVAPYDSTEITIKPSDKTYLNGLNQQNIRLMKGQTYLVQVLIDNDNLKRDLTGTEIISNKPVAVFSGHQRATIPVNGNGVSRDHIVEELPPVNTWGNSAILIPFMQPTGITSNGNDIYRILAANDFTDIYIDSIFITSLNKGQYYESDLIKAAYIKSSKTILVAEYKKTSSSSTANLYEGDPFMMIIPNTDQFGTFFKFIGIQTYEDRNLQNTPVYEETYIEIVADTNSITGVKLDGFPVAPSKFRTVTNSGYTYATFPVDFGAHQVESMKPVGLYVYGYGIACSYGYSGGLNLDVNETSVPENNPPVMDNNILISPNPATGIVTITIPNSGLLNKSLIIFNSLGGEIKRFGEKEISWNNSVSFSVLGLPSGMYYCTVNDGRNVITKNFVVVR